MIHICHIKYYDIILKNIKLYIYYVRKHTSYTCVHTLTSKFFLEKPIQM